jgi:hypothetical protein
MSVQQRIFLNRIYASTNSNHFIKIQHYTVLAEAGERRRLPSPQSFSSEILDYTLELVDSSSQVITVVPSSPA